MIKILVYISAKSTLILLEFFFTILNVRHPHTPALGMAKVPPPPTPLDKHKDFVNNYQ